MDYAIAAHDVGLDDSGVYYKHIVPLGHDFHRVALCRLGVLELHLIGGHSFGKVQVVGQHSRESLPIFTQSLKFLLGKGPLPVKAFMASLEVKGL